MSSHDFLVVALFSGTLCVTAGCSSKSGGPGNQPPGSGGSGATDPCGMAVDFASYASAPAMSLKNDIMPIFGLSCSASLCHNQRDKNAGLDLGVRCHYDAASGTCQFPATADTSGTQPNPPAPLTDQILQDVYASLLAPARTVDDGSVKRVEPGNPQKSFIVMKMSGVQNDQGFTCTNQDSTHSSNPQPCGDSMPLNNPPECSTAGKTPPRVSFDKIAAWIAQGAPNN